MTLDLIAVVQEAKQEFDRTIACKHTVFDDLYPYMIEHQSFFWYKRYSAWASLLTTIRIAGLAGINWQAMFRQEQVEMIQNQILNKQVLDEWLEPTSPEKNTVLE